MPNDLTQMETQLLLWALNRTIAQMGGGLSADELAHMQAVANKLRRTLEVAASLEKLIQG
jgi:hypothetical protein